MLDQSLIKNNFIGKDGFIWWLGQIPPEETHHGQINGAGWGNRVKVRIMGYDCPDLPNEDLRWANVLLSPTDGSGAANQANSLKLSPGDTVFGFFLDGAPDYSVPVIIGVFGRTSLYSSNPYSGAFKPYTGYTSKIFNDGAYFVKNESNEQNANSQKSPRLVPPSKVKQIGGVDERSGFDGIGDTIRAATGSQSNSISKISTEINNFVNKIQTITDKVSGAIANAEALINEEIAKITAKIQKISTGLVAGMVNSVYESMAPVLNAGLKLLYRTVYAIVFAATQSDPIAHQAGVAAQRAMVAPVQAIRDALPCVVNSILGSIANTITGLLRAVAENVTNFVTCISDQFVGGLMNNVIGGVETLLSPILGGVQSILMGFDLVSSMRSNAEGLLGSAIKMSCNEVAPNFNSPTNEWVIGKGAKQAAGVSMDTILESANIAAAIAESVSNTGDAINSLPDIVGAFDFLNDGFSNPGFQGLISDCYGGPPLNCGGVNVNIFGSNGSGAVAKAILGSIVGEEAANLTGSIIGIDVLDGGSNYDFPPFVEITDECGRGYGAVARSVIDYNPDSPTYGQVTSIYLVSEGENYPVGDQDSYVVDDIIIVNSGIGYTNNDKVIDPNQNVQYNVQVGAAGEITKVLTINSNLENVQEVSEITEFIVQSSTGYGAILKPKLKPRPVYQGKIEQQIDCISK